MQKPFNPLTDRQVPADEHAGETAIERARRLWVYMGGDPPEQEADSLASQVIEFSGHSTMWFFDKKMQRFLREESFGKLRKQIMKMIERRGRVAVESMIKHSTFTHQIYNLVYDLFPDWGDHYVQR